MKLIDVLCSWKSFKALVIGDVLLDRYTFGNSHRLSPEAPIPIFDFLREEEHPGAAGNVALNLRALGAEVSLMGRVGADEAGRSLRRMLIEEGVDISALCEEGQLPTIVKNRFIAQGHQMMRVDREEKKALAEHCKQDFFTYLREHLSSFDVVLVSDYAKGCLDEDLLSFIIKEASDLEIPLVLDPKNKDFSRYRGVKLLKPNEAELRIAASLDEGAPLKKVAEKIIEETACELLVVTRSEAGISAFSKDHHWHCPVHLHEVRDVTGAGDTVLAISAAAMALQIPIPEYLLLANIAAGVVIERLGCASVSVTELIARSSASLEFAAF